MNFQAALAFVLRWEGGFADDPQDHGGATMKGITQSTYDAYRKSLGLRPTFIRDITEAEIDDIYHQLYWVPVRGDDLPADIRLPLFDFAVNAGPTRAIAHLQRILGVEVDGAIGPHTLAAVQSASGLREKLLADREGYYRAIVEHDPTQEKFLKGWLNRVAAVRDQADQADHA